jgi:hypothetical protein
MEGDRQRVDLDAARPPGTAKHGKDLGTRQSDEIPLCLQSQKAHDVYPGRIWYEHGPPDPSIHYTIPALILLDLPRLIQIIEIINKVCRRMLLCAWGISIVCHNTGR